MVVLKHDNCRRCLFKYVERTIIYGIWWIITPQKQNDISNKINYNEEVPDLGRQSKKSKVWIAFQDDVKLTIFCLGHDRQI
jgi:hypothetical protein